MHVPQGGDHRRDLDRVVGAVEHDRPTLPDAALEATRKPGPAQARANGVKVDLPLIALCQCFHHAPDEAGVAGLVASVQTEGQGRTAGHLEDRPVRSDARCAAVLRGVDELQLAPATPGFAAMTSTTWADRSRAAKARPSLGRIPAFCAVISARVLPSTSV